MNCPAKVSVPHHAGRGTDSSPGFVWKCQLLSCARLSETPRAIDHQAPLSRILQARILEWVAIPFSRGSFRPKDWTRFSSLPGFTIWASRQAPEFVRGTCYINRSHQFHQNQMTVMAPILQMRKLRLGEVQSHGSGAAELGCNQRLVQIKSWYSFRWHHYTNSQRCWWEQIFP